MKKVAKAYFDNVALSNSELALTCVATVILLLILVWEAMGKSFLVSSLCLSADFRAPPKEKEHLSQVCNHIHDDDKKNHNQHVSCHRGANSCPF